MTPQQLENFVYRMTGKANEGKGTNKERRFKESNNDGKFNCVDRAFVAQRVAREHGYEATKKYQFNKDRVITHVYLELKDKDGKVSEIMKSRVE